MKDFIANNAAGPTGIFGLFVAKFPEQPPEWLVILSIGLVTCQVIHWGFRFYKWVREQIKGI